MDLAGEGEADNVKVSTVGALLPTVTVAVISSLAPWSSVMVAVQITSHPGCTVLDVKTNSQGFPDDDNEPVELEARSK